MKDSLRSSPIYWQAHQSSGVEAPENTMAAFKYAWELGGIPEADICTSRDGVIICMHDNTPARTTNAPSSEKDRPISSFTLNQIKKWDAGIKFDEKFKCERAPALKDVFEVLRKFPQRQIYIDLKEVNLEDLGKLINEYGVNGQSIFCHCNQQNCIEVQKIAGVRTMLWIGGSSQGIKEKFNNALESGFKGLNQVQLHLNDRDQMCEWRYQIEVDYLIYAYKKTKEFGVDLEVLPFKFDDKSLNTLLELGISWYATDHPKRFLKCVNNWKHL